MTTRVGYKLLLSFSCTSLFGLPHAYGLDEKTVPLLNCGPLLVFKTIAHASAWWSWGLSCRVALYRCEYEPWAEKLPRTMWGASVYAWYPWGESGARDMLLNIPPGTRLAKSVTLRELIQPDDPAWLCGQEEHRKRVEQAQAYYAGR
jgi:hypothetical protein